MPTYSPPLDPALLTGTEHDARDHTGVALTEVEHDARDHTGVAMAGHPLPPSGQWIAAGQGNSGGTLTAERVALVGVWLPDAVAIDRLAIHVSGAGTAGAVYRLGAYQANTTSEDMSLIVDAGTVDATTTGAKQATVSATLPAGLVWLAAVEQGGATTPPQCHRLTSDDRPAWLNSTAFLTSTFRGLQSNASFSGALPDNFATYGFGTIQLPPNLQARVA